MLTFKQYIEEAFDKPYPYKLKYYNEAKGRFYEATAKLKDKSELLISFEEDDSDEWFIEFFRDDTIDATGEGDQMRVFATVIAAIKEFIKKESPKKIVFTADKGKGGKDSREKLYSRMVKRFASQLGYNSKEQSKSRTTTYTLIKKG